MGLFHPPDAHRAVILDLALKAEARLVLNVGDAGRGPVGQQARVSHLHNREGVGDPETFLAYQVGVLRVQELRLTLLGDGDILVEDGLEERGLGCWFLSHDPETLTRLAGFVYRNAQGGSVNFGAGSGVLCGAATHKQGQLLRATQGSYSGQVVESAGIKWALSRLSRLFGPISISFRERRFVYNDTQFLPVYNKLRVEVAQVEQGGLTD